MAKMKVDEAEVNLRSKTTAKMTIVVKEEVGR
jgi:hypothetical protein